MTNRWTWHGGGLQAAQAQFPECTQNWIDLSTGINPHPWDGVDNLSIDWRRLPEEQGLHALEQAAADHFGCAVDHICALPGTEVGLRIVGETLDGPTFHVTPSYRTHGEMISGSQPIHIDAVKQADCASLILANPNNPDGRLLASDMMRSLLDRRGPKGWLLLDEAFADCHPNHSLATEVSDDKRLLIFRSFGKFFGLAGLRLGFVLGPRAIIASLRQRLGAWPVSAAAISIGTFAYRDHVWISNMRTRLMKDAEMLDAVLQSHGFQPEGCSPLFRLIRHSSAFTLFEHLAKFGILTRPFAHDATWLRVGLPANETELRRLDEALMRV